VERVQIGSDQTLLSNAGSQVAAAGLAVVVPTPLQREMEVAAARELLRRRLNFLLRERALAAQT